MKCKYLVGFHMNVICRVRILPGLFNDDHKSRGMERPLVQAMLRRRRLRQPVAISLLVSQVAAMKASLLIRDHCDQ
jgi:hypothetical protein